MAKPETRQMDAVLYDNIEMVENMVSIASPEHFVLGEGRPADARMIIEDKNWSLYYYDKESQSALFVELPEGTDLAQSAFAYSDQHRRAQRALSVPFSVIEVLAQEIAPPEKIIFVFSIGRCGSTLVSNILNEIEDVWCLSEPDAYTRLLLESHEDGVRANYSREQAISLIQIATRLLFRPPAGSAPQVFAVKFRSQSTVMIDLFHAAYPDAKFVFLYRDAISWSDSFYRMVQKFDVPSMTPRESCLFLWQVLSAAASTDQLAALVDIDGEDVQGIDAFTPAWAHYLDCYSAALAAGVPFIALRYNELNTDRVESLTALLDHCGLPAEEVGAALQAFAKDSQAGTLIARDVKAEALSSEEKVRLGKILARHKRFSSPDLLLPDIYRPV